MMKPCSGPHNEPVPAEVGDLCMPHYQQQRRNPRRALRPIRTAPGEGDQVRFRIPRELKAATEKAAKSAKIDPSEWWRRLAEDKLGIKRLLLIVLVALGSHSCGRKRIPVANTAEGKACVRECMLVYQTCMGARGGGRHVCQNQQDDCLRTCPAP